MKKNPKAYLVGGGIASLSAAVYLIQEGGMKGNDIRIFDESKRAGGSLDAQDLSSSEGYVMRGIRMFEEETFTSSFDLMSRIPSLTVPGKNLREEFVQFNAKNRSYSKSRLVKNKKAINSHPLQLSFVDRMKIVSLIFRTESSLEKKEIREYFSPSFFESNFWYEFCTVFAFQPWHSLIEFRRYFIRFIQSFSQIDTLETIEIAPHNQYEFLIVPTVAWLIDHGVRFETNTRVVDLDFESDDRGKAVTKIYCERDHSAYTISVDAHDLVFVTLGSIVGNSTQGSMDAPAVLNNQTKNAAWTLWENIASKDPQFGKPEVFNTHIDKSQWTSFTITLRDPLFFTLMNKYINKEITAYGGINLIDSHWFTSIVLSYNPYFVNQPENVDLCWGFGLRACENGNFIKKKMAECTGREILTELVHHLGFEENLEKILETSVCIPSTTPLITSQFLPRSIADRPHVVPENSVNFAFLGQYTEMSQDVVFTVEYSIRTAQKAVFSLCKLNKKPSPIYHGTHHFMVLFSALKTLMR